MAGAAEWKTVPPPPPPAGRVFHAGRQPNPFYWRIPTPLDPDNPAGARFDDPNGEYATMYCATTRYGALLEKLSPLRPIPELAAHYSSALDDDAEPAHNRPPTGAAFPSDLTESILMGSVSVDPDRRFIDVDDPHNHRLLESIGGTPLLNMLGIGRIDRGAFITPDRRLTRIVAGELHAAAGGEIGGLRYSSVIDQAAECWAIWQSEDALFAYDVEPFDLASPDLLAVITLLGFDPPS